MQIWGRTEVRKKDVRIHNLGWRAVTHGKTMSQCGKVASASLVDCQIIRQEKNVSELIGTAVHTYLHIHLLSNMNIQLFIHSVTNHSLDIIQG